MPGLSTSARNLINIPAEKLHTLCLQLAPESSYQGLYQSFVCGASLKDPFLASSFTQSGLIHVVVVSGAHLIFLEVLLSYLDPRSRFTFPFLALYSLVTGFKPPIARSLLQIMLVKFSERFQLHWSSPLVTMGAGLLTMALLGSSLSLSLSWLASLALHVPKSTALKTQVRIYLLLFPILASLGPAHPLAIVINVLFVPVLSALAFPLSLACFVFPPLTLVMDPLWQGFHDLLKILGAEIELHTSALWSAGAWLGIYVALVQLGALAFHIWHKRTLALKEA